MPQSPTDIPSVITADYTDIIIPSVKFSREIFLVHVAVCNIVGVSLVFGFFNYRQN